MTQRLRLSTQIVLLVLTIVVLSVSVGLGVSVYDARNNVNRETGREALAIARTVATVPAIRQAFGDRKPWLTIDPIAERIRKMTGAAFVVVANRQGIRYSHPNKALLGKSLLNDPGENPAPVLAGESQVVVQSGSLGRSMRAKVPIFVPATGKVIGLVSVGEIGRAHV